MNTGRSLVDLFRRVPLRWYAEFLAVFGGIVLAGTLGWGIHWRVEDLPKIGVSLVFALVLAAFSYNTTHP